MLGQHRRKLGQVHRQVQVHKQVQEHRLGQVCRQVQGHTGEQQRQQPKEQTKQQSTRREQIILYALDTSKIISLLDNKMQIVKLVGVTVYPAFRKKVFFKKKFKEIL